MSRHPFLGKLGRPKDSFRRTRRLSEYGLVVGTITTTGGRENLVVFCADGTELSLSPSEFEECPPERSEKVRKLVLARVNKGVESALKKRETVRLYLA